MSNVNQCNFIGRTGKDVELRYTPSGKAVASVSIAVSEKFKDGQGQPQEHTEWINLVAWERTAEIMSQYVKKGHLIYVSGKMQTRSYDDRDGNKRYITEIRVNQMQMLTSRSNSEGGQQRQNHNQDRQTGQSQGGSQGGGGGGASGGYQEPTFNPDDDIPFAMPQIYRETVR